MKLKKMLAVFSALCMMCAVVPLTQNSFPENTVLSANAVETVTEGMLTFKKYADHAEVSKCNTLAMKVEIPAEIDGLPVTVIGGFHYCTSLTIVTIPNSVTIIGDYAFSGCSNLTSAAIPDSVVSIGKEAFFSCPKLTSVTIPAGTTSIGEGSFRGCSGLTSLTISGGVPSIGKYAFANCSGLTSIAIPDSVTSIGAYAFNNCSGLTSVTIPNSIKSIEALVFGGCSSLTSITIPSGVTSIGYHTFYECPALTSITILNPYCDIYSDYYALGGTNSKDNTSITIYGEEFSTAQAYAEKYNYSFKVIDVSSQPETNDDIQYMKENEITLDFNKDGNVNTKDASWILVYAAERGAGTVKSMEEFFQKNNLN